MLTQRQRSRLEKPAADGTRTCYVCNTRKMWNTENFSFDPRSSKPKGTCRECIIASSVRAHWMRAYGVTVEQVEQMILDQDGKCAICKTTLERGKGMKKKVNAPHIDHNHKTGKVRGILCHHCNVFIGHAKEDSTILIRSMAYLESRV